MQFALEVQDSLATMVMPVLAKGRRGSRGQDRAAGEPPPKEKMRWKVLEAGRRYATLTPDAPMGASPVLFTNTSLDLSQWTKLIVSR